MKLSRKFEMANFSTETVCAQFDHAVVDGRPVVVCKLCDRQLIPNRGVMSMHYRMKHCNPSDNSSQSIPFTGKPLHDKPQAFAHQASDRNACTDVCPQVLQRHLSNKVADGYTADVYCGSSAATDFDSRRRCRAVHTLYYLAAEPSDSAYATLIERTDELVISVIRAVAREYNEGSMGCLSPLESLALSRYRKSIGNLADYDISLKRTREVLLKPHKRRRHVPESVEYVPMLLTLALTKSGLAKYVDDFDESIDLDDDSEESENGDDIQDGDDEDGEAEPKGESESDEDDDQEADADSEEIEEGPDEEAEADSQEREEGDDQETESGSQEGEEGDDEETESGSEEGEEGDVEETESGSQESEEGDDEETGSGSEEGEEGDDEETESGSEEGEEGDVEETESGSEESEEGDDEETGSESEESESTEPDESEELESEGDEPEEDDVIEAESEEKDLTDQQPAKNLKRPHAELSITDMWVKRSRRY
jgi:hypothetical protein